MGQPSGPPQPSYADRGTPQAGSLPPYAPWRESLPENQTYFENAPPPPPTQQFLNGDFGPGVSGFGPEFPEAMLRQSRYGSPAAPAAPSSPPTAAPETEMVQPSWVPSTEVRTIPLTAADRPKGEINPGIDPSTLPIASELAGLGNEDAELRFMPPKLEGRNFEPPVEWKPGRFGGLIPRLARGVPEPSAETTILSSVFDNPEDKKQFFARALSPDNPNAIHLEYIDGELYQLGKDGRYYYVVRPDKFDSVF